MKRLKVHHISEDSIIKTTKYCLKKEEEKGGRNRI
jgi:hypothetical protein